VGGDPGEDSGAVMSESRKVIDYTTIASEAWDNEDDFDELVCDAIKRGWQPWYGMVVSVEAGRTYQYQAMVKYEE
jgi:hypothetical protein